MRTICKLAEPPNLAAHRAKPGAVFDKRGLTHAKVLPAGNPELPTDAKNELRARLLEEQRGLCCYCCNRITASGDVRIEHWEPLSKCPEHQLSYWNLMLACRGKTSLRDEDHEHCDLKKGDSRLQKNPSNPKDRVEEIIHYLTNGEIRSSDSLFDAQLGEDALGSKADPERTLNLNTAFFLKNRRAILDGVKTGITKRGTLKPADWQRLLDLWTGA